MPFDPTSSRYDICWRLCFSVNANITNAFTKYQYIFKHAKSAALSQIALTNATLSIPSVRVIHKEWLTKFLFLAEPYLSKVKYLVVADFRAPIMLKNRLHLMKKIKSLSVVNLNGEIVASLIAALIVHKCILTEFSFTDSTQNSTINTINIEPVFVFMYDNIQSFDIDFSSKVCNRKNLECSKLGQHLSKCTNLTSFSFKIACHYDFKTEDVVDLISKLPTSLLNLKLIFITNDSKYPFTYTLFDRIVESIKKLEQLTSIHIEFTHKIASPLDKSRKFPSKLKHITIKGLLLMFTYDHYFCIGEHISNCKYLDTLTIQNVVFYGEHSLYIIWLKLILLRFKKLTCINLENWYCDFKRRIIDVTYIKQIESVFI